MHNGLSGAGGAESGSGALRTERQGKFFGGVPAGKQPAALNTNLIHYKQLLVSSTTRSSLTQFRRTLEFIAAGLLNVDALVTDTYALEQTPEAFSNAAHAKGLKHVICRD